MIWSVVAQRHMESFERARASLGAAPRKAFAVPNFAEGYCTDDNARAYILTLFLEETTSR